jgi:hypothetical protein
MSVLTYALWGLARKRHLYRPVYYSVFLMSMLTFLSLALLQWSAKEIAATAGNGYSSRVADAPVLLFVLGTAVGIVQVLLVLVRIQLLRVSEYRLLGSLGFSRGWRALVAVIESTGHIAMASGAAVVASASAITIAALLVRNMWLLESYHLLFTVPLAILLPMAISLPICAMIAAKPPRSLRSEEE